MFREIKKLEDLIFSPLKMVVPNIQKDLECEEYLGYNFQLGQFKIKFRKAKITPKKIGQFVTLWKRNSDGITEPFSTDDDLDFCLIVTEQNENFSFFLFPKSILTQKLVLSTPVKEGKRGFRVYPDWDSPENKQAKKTKSWQTEYFIANHQTAVHKFEKILKA